MSQEALEQAWQVMKFSPESDFSSDKICQTCGASDPNQMCQYMLNAEGRPNHPVSACPEYQAS